MEPGPSNKNIKNRKRSAASEENVVDKARKLEEGLCCAVGIPGWSCHVRLFGPVATLNTQILLLSLGVSDLLIQRTIFSYYALAQAHAFMSSLVLPAVCLNTGASHATEARARHPQPWVAVKPSASAKVACVVQIPLPRRNYARMYRLVRIARTKN